MRFLAIVLVAACGGGGQSPADAAEPDVPIDTPVGPLAAHHYVVDQQLVPRNNSEARTLGLDLNDDAVIDNQLGMVIATLAGQGLDTQAQVDTAVDTGTTIALVELGTENNFGPGGGSFALFAGANPNPAACNSPNDTVCRRHLQGDATFDIAANDPRNAALLGSFNGASFTSTATGLLRVHVPLLTEAPIALDLVGARVVVRANATEVMDSIVAGGVTQNELNTEVIPQMQTSFAAAVQRDCGGAGPPTCGCANPSTGRTMLGLFDTSPQDCSISLAEVQNNTLIQSLLAPDIMLNGVPVLSFGMGITGVPATFTP
jgi:hypothetical protein